MEVNAIGNGSQKVIIPAQRAPKFGASQSYDNYYENPIDRKTEKGLAILRTTSLSAIIGVVAGWLTKSFAKEATWKLPVGIGAAAAALTMIFTLPGALYGTKVRAFAREKEMDVFSRQKETQSDLYDNLNQEIRNDYVPLDQKINHYTTVKMAENGNGMMIKGA